MRQVERFDVWRQRQALLALADDPQEFLGSAEGFAFCEQIAVLMAPAIVGYARGKMGYALEVDDVVSIAITGLCAKSGNAAEYCAAAIEEPWGYVATCLRGWARAEWGVRGRDIEIAEFLPAPAPTEDMNDYTELSQVVELTFQALAPVTDERLHTDLYELLGWLAANPLTRLSYETDERVAAHRHCPGLTIEQVTAVMNIAWGGRPRQAETSIMGQFLLNPEFRPSDSPTHARALTYYKHQMRAGALGSRMLTDWI